MDEKNLALEGIRKKLVGKRLSYKEIFAIMDQIAHDKLGQILTTYFVASGYSQGFSDKELFYLTRAMVETGEHLHFGGIVADKHSIGGTPGTRVTMIVVPIIAAAGYKIPKSSSRAITTPAGTADCMETIAKVAFPKDEIYDIVESVGGCIVWGGSVNIAPADDDIIRIEEPLLFESYDKILVSVMAKKIAFGATHVIIDIPYGKTVKVHRQTDGESLGKKFETLAKEFNIILKSYVHHVDQPAGSGIGPTLEARDALRVLEQTKDRPIALEERAVTVAAMLLELCLKQDEKKRKEIENEFKTVEAFVKNILTTGQAEKKMREIIKAQKGNPNVLSTDLKGAEVRHEIKVENAGEVSEINNKNLTVIAKILGAPTLHNAGLDLHVSLASKVQKNDVIATLYTNSKSKIEEALDTLDLFPIVEIR